MRLKGIMRVAVSGLTVAIFALTLSCGGGGGKISSTTPLVSGSGAERVGTFTSDYVEGLVMPESEIGNLSPELQALFAHPGWSGPPTPTPPAGPAPVPEVMSVEDVMNIYRGGEVIEEAIPSRGARYFFDEEEGAGDIDPGTYDPDEYDNNPPTEEPPFGSDEDENLRDDRIENSDPLRLDNMYGKTYLDIGVPRQNFFNSGGLDAGGGFIFENNQVYQGFVTVSGGSWPWVEVGYRADQDFASGYTDDAYFIEGPIYELWQSTADEVQPLEWPQLFKWYEVMSYAVSDEDAGPGDAGYESPMPGLGTLASVQYFGKDTTANSPIKYPLSHPDYPVNAPTWADSMVVKLMASDKDKIQQLVDKRDWIGRADPNLEPDPVNYAGTFPVFGAIFQRWHDDVFILSQPSPQRPWEGPLGWPVSPPRALGGGARMVGEDGYQFIRFEQRFEKGILYWDWVFGNRPDRVWVFRVPEDKESVFDVTDPEDFVQDAKVVRYGTGGPYGVVAWVSAADGTNLFNLGEPAYFKAFPFGGPSNNSFTDDYFAWRFRDGYIGFGQYITKAIDPLPYDYQARFVARVMLVLNPGTGVPDTNYVAFGDTDEFIVGTKGVAPPGGGTPVLLIDQDADDGNLNKWKGDMDAEGISYDVKPTGEVAGDPSIMENYLVTILAPSKDTSVWGPRPGGWNSAIETPILNFVKGGGKVIIFMTQWYFRDLTDFSSAGVFPQDWRNVFTIGGYNGWYCFSCGTFGLSGSPLGTGPGGNFNALNMTYKQNHLGAVFEPPPYQYQQLASYEFSTLFWTIGAGIDPSWGGGKGVGSGTEYGWALGTNPPSGGTGTSKFLLNLFNYVDPDILAGGGGGGGGGGFQPYVGPVQIGDPTIDPPRSGVFAWVVNPGATPPASIKGGDGRDAFDDPHPFTADISVVSEPGTIHYEAMAHGDPDEDGEDDLGYEWQFYPDWMYEPGQPLDGQPKWEFWPRYTEHQYAGGIDGDITNDYDGDGDPTNDAGEPFMVRVRVWDADQFATFDDALAADPDGSLGYWAISGVYVIVRGPKPVDIEDDGSEYKDSYAPDENGEVSVTLKFSLSGGEPEAVPGTYYDDLDLDIDYDGFTYDQDVEMYFVDTNNDGIPDGYPGAGNWEYTYTTDQYQTGNTYTVAGRVEDDVAPNFEDIYVWEDWVFVASPIAVVVDTGGTSNANAIKTDLTGLGLGYVELQSSQISSSSDLEAYAFVIWAPAQSPNQISTTESNIQNDYVRNKGGNFFLPYNYLYYMYYIHSQQWREMMGATYYFSWYASYYTVPSSSYDGKTHVWYTGWPGNYQVTRVYGQYTSPITDIYYYYRYWLSDTWPICGEAGWDPWYEDGGTRHNSSVDGENWGAWFGNQWDRLNQDQSGSGTHPNVDRKELLGRILDKMDPTILPGP